MRPTIEDHSNGSGLSEEDHKTVILFRAVIKLSMHTVPDEDLLKIYELFKQHIQKITPPTVRSTVNLIKNCDASNVEIHIPFSHLAEVSYKQGYSFDPITKRDGGSLAVTT